MTISPHQGNEVVTRPPAPRQHYIPVLDGLRGIAISAVLMNHFVPIVQAGALSRTFSHVASLGWLGVDLFFVLSGFLITGILQDTKGTPGYFLNFYARRTLRIFPLYYAVLIFTMILLPAVWPAFARDTLELRRDQSSLWTYCTNFRLAYDGSYSLSSYYICLNHFWSLAVEEQFYLVWPFLVFALKPKPLAFVCGVLCALALIARIYWIVFHDDNFTPYVLLPGRMDMLAFGALAAIIMRSRFNSSSTCKVALILFIAGAASILFLDIQKTNLSLDERWTRTVGLSAIAISFASSIVWLLTSQRQTWVHSILTSYPLRLLGKYSYGIYVYHGLLIFDFLRWLDASRLTGRISNSFSGQIVQLGFCSTISIGMAVISWHLFEKHFLRLKRYFEYASNPRPSIAN